MSDFTWYTRLLTWVGAMVLLIESITGRPFALITVLAVIMLAAGLLLFAGGLAFEGRFTPLQFATIGEAPRQETDQIAPVVSAVAAPSRATATEEEARPDRAIEWPPIPQEAVGETAAPLAPAPPMSRPAVSPHGAETVEVAETDSLRGRPCFRCHESLRAGQTAALCPDCGGAHHATCWVGNHFHCAREGCGGQGGLLAPNR